MKIDVHAAIKAAMKENAPAATRAAKENQQQQPQAQSLHGAQKIGNWGATPGDWTHFDLVLGLSSDLLPVVSNLTAEISPNSKVTEIGKAPSLYNCGRKVVGIPRWTSYQASYEEIDRWGVEPDYGICLQTRTVRALDIDVPDGLKAARITDFVADRLGLVLPTRYRANSGKVLLAFSLQGEMKKRKIVVEGGIVEFLATGEQFVAIGTHQSGVRYEWSGGLPCVVPALGLDEFEALWSSLAEMFAIEAPTKGGTVSLRKRGDHVAMDDPVAKYLLETGRVLGEDRDGALIVACPWEREHTTGEQGDSSTVWFPAGTNGYDRGNFKCLHGHCEGRNASDFFEAVGYVEDMAAEFDVVEAFAGELPNFSRTKAGAILATKENVTKALARPDFCGWQLRHDVFRDEIMLAPPGTDEWRSFKDTDYTALCMHLERGGRGFKDIPKERIRDGVAYVADANRFDSARRWLDMQKWDGVRRVVTFLSRYFGAEDSPYTRAVSIYIWTALSGRVLQPGVKADMVPVAVGAQGAKKSSTVAAIVPSPDFFLELDLGSKDDDLARLMRGKLVIELGELKGLRAREVEHIKAFITKQHEEWRPAYKEFTTRYARRCIFFGTTNKDEFLADDTGHRRWLPFHTGECDPDGVIAARGQLWAEARELFTANGVMWLDAEKLARNEHDAFVVRDAWEEIVERWLVTPEHLTDERPGDSPFTSVAALEGAIRLDAKFINQSAKDRMAKVLKALGYVQDRAYINGKRARVYVRAV